MQRFLTGPGVLAAALLAGLANPGFAFQEAEQVPESTRPETRAQNENSHGGQFDSFGRGYIRMKIERGKSHLHNVTDETQVMIDGEPAQLNNLRTGDDIQVTMGPNNVALRIEAFRNTARERSAPREGQGRSQRPDFEDQPQDRENLQGEQEATPWLGVILSDAEEGQQGVQIRQTFPSGPAARAGLRSGDVLLQIGGKEVASPEDAAKIIEASKPNETLEMVVLRGEREVNITATLANRSDFLFGEQRSRGQDGQGEFPEFEGSNIPEHAMMLEQHRHLAAQHERIEQKLDQVLEELEALRKAMGQTPGAARPELQEPPPRSPEAEASDVDLPAPGLREPRPQRNEAKETAKEQRESENRKNKNRGDEIPDAPRR